MTRTDLMNSVEGMACDNTTNVVDVYISYLRNKIEMPHAEKLILTVKGRGYMIQQPAN